MGEKKRNSTHKERTSQENPAFSFQFFSSNPEKRWTEIFFLKASAWWLTIFSGVVATKIYLDFADLEYMILGILCAFPYFTYPFFFGPKNPKPIMEQYWFKANLWLFIFGFVGNYLWTHYFFRVLHATYTFPVWLKLNEVPVHLYLITHAYFCMYHTMTNIAIRLFWQLASVRNSSRFTQMVLYVIFIFSLSYFTAFMEAFTISSVPYYVIEDRYKMYVIGSAFYGIYFYISFPLFFTLDEKPSESWAPSQVVMHSLACTMAVTLLLDFWRLFLGAIVDDQNAASQGPPWIQ